MVKSSKVKKSPNISEGKDVSSKGTLAPDTGKKETGGTK